MGITFEQEGEFWYVERTKNVTKNVFFEMVSRNCLSVFDSTPCTGQLNLPLPDKPFAPEQIHNAQTNDKEYLTTSFSGCYC